MMTNSEMTTRICKVIKKRFPKMNDIKVVDLAYKIVEELNK